MGLNGVVSGYATSTDIFAVDGGSIDPRVLGRHMRYHTTTDTTQILVS